jgi:hypothetical protein
MKKLTLTLIIPLLLLTLLAPAFAAPVAHETPAVTAMEQGEFVLTATAPDGSILWEERAANAFADEGEQLILDVFLRGAAAPTQFYLRLFNDTPVETDGLAALTGEPSGNGYRSGHQQRRDVHRLGRVHRPRNLCRDCDQLGQHRQADCLCRPEPIADAGVSGRAV